MPIALDLHTHTIMSGHAYSTLEENAAHAARVGLEGLAVTDHGPALAGAPVDLYFLNQIQLPRWIDETFILRGAEVNIIDFEGTVDLVPRALKRLDLCIASFHEVCIQPGTMDQHTTAWEAVVSNPLIDIMGHPGRGEYIFDIDHIVQLCAANHKLVEINNHTMHLKGNHDDCLAIAKACMRYQVPVVVNSDAHFSRSVGRVELAEALLAEIDFPEALILNRSRQAVIGYLKERKPHLQGL